MWLTLLLLIIPGILSSTCSPSVSNSTAIFIQQGDSFQTFSTVIIFGVAIGPISHNMYYMYYLDANPTFDAAVRKVNNDDTTAWVTILPFGASEKSLTLDQSENSVYLAAWNLVMIVVKLVASNGSVISSQTFSSIDGRQDGVKVHIIPDNSGYILLSIKSASSNTNICKYIFTISASAECQEIPSFNSLTYGQLQLSENEYFFAAYDTTFNSMHLCKITFGSINADWTQKLLCSSGTCTVFDSESQFNNDSSKIYSLTIFGSSGNQFMYLNTFNASNGGVIGSRYKSSVNCVSVFGSSRRDYNFIATLYCIERNILIFNTETNSILFKAFLGSGIYQCNTEYESGRIIIIGSKGANGYITKFMINAISAQSDFSSTSSIAMNVLSSGTEDFIFESSISINSPASIVVSVGSYSNQTSALYIQGSISISDVYFQTNDQSFSVVENNIIKITPDLPCSSSGTTLISFSIANYNGDISPSWVSINSGTGELSVGAPDVSSDTKFYFYINSLINGSPDPIHKLIKLTIKNCIAQNCEKCQNANNTECSLCNSGYYLSSGICITQKASSKFLTNSADTASTITQSIVGATIVIVSVSSLMNTSSMASLWLMVHQIQMFFLLLLTGAFIPDYVQIAITGSEFVINPFDYISFQKLKFYESFIKKFNFSLSNSSLSSIGVNSDSTIYNTNSMLIILFIIIFFHLGVYTLIKLCFYNENDHNCLCFGSKFYCFTNKIFNILTFGYYIRNISEMSQYLLISAINEIYVSRPNRLLKLTSFIYALLVLSCIIIFTIISLYLALSSYKLTRNNHNKLGELFEGLKIYKKCKLYSPVLLIRRIIFIVILLVFISVRSTIIVGTLTLLQIIYCVYICFLRPFVEIKCNMIEIINECIFLFLLSSLNYLKIEEYWSSTLTSAYIWTIVFNSIVVFFIILVATIKTAIVKCKQRCCESTSSQSNNQNEVKIFPRHTTMEQRSKFEEDIGGHHIAELPDQISPSLIVEEIKKEDDDQSCNNFRNRIKYR